MAPTIVVWITLQRVNVALSLAIAGIQTLLAPIRRILSVRYSSGPQLTWLE